MSSIAVIGGGASGLAAAIHAAGTRTRVTVFERNPRVGKKLLATGNGRCNLTHIHADTEHLHRFHGENVEFARAALAAFSPEDTVAFFEKSGVLCKGEESGRVYPAC